MDPLLIDRVLAVLGAVVVIGTVLDKVLAFAVPRLQAYAATTDSEVDDKVVMALGVLAAVLAILLDTAHALMPRVAMGRSEPK